MPVEEPRWWYRDEATIEARILTPFAAAYGLAARWRYRRGARFRPSIPVVCIGNFTAGGTGKTPFAIRLARDLVGRGLAPAFLSRGYGGRLSGPVWVQAEKHRAADVGDEPLLLARTAPTLVSRDRAVGARSIAGDARRFDVIVMDDGLQNASVAKDLAIVVVDARRGLGNTRVIPAGPLRAPLDFQIGLADVVVLNAPGGWSGETGKLKQWLAARFAGPILSGTTEPAQATEWLRTTPVLAYCGIGAPQRFFDLLTSLGARVVDRTAYPDHHPLTDHEARDLLARADAAGAMLVTTEKDLVRLGATEATRALRDRSRALEIRFTLADADVSRLRESLDRLLARPVPGS